MEISYIVIFVYIMLCFYQERQITIPGVTGPLQFSILEYRECVLGHFQ